MSREFVVNGKSLAVNTIHTSLDPNAVDRIELDSPILGGRVKATLSDGSVTAAEYVSDQGSEVHQYIEGVAFERRSAIEPVRKPNYNIAYVNDTTILDNKRFFDNTPDWPELGTSPAKPVTKSGFGLLPSGGFVIRDAWGSEIRMEKGDIQLSAANNIVATTHNDIVIYCGGVLSTITAKGFDLLSHGKTSICTPSDLCIHTGEQLTVTAKAAYCEANEYSVTIGNTKIQLNKNAISLDCVTLKVTTSAGVLYGRDKLMLATPATALVSDDRRIRLAAGIVTVNGDLSVSDKQYRPGKIDNQAINPVRGSGDLLVSGNITGLSQLHCDKDIFTAEHMYAKAMHASSRDSELGVFRSTTPKKAEAFNKQGISSWIGSDINVTGPIVSVAPLTTSKKLPFNISQTAIKVVNPLYMGDRANIQPKIHIDNTSNDQYIYPGDNFWNGGSGLCELTDTEGSLLDEKRRDEEKSISNLKI